MVTAGIIPTLSYSTKEQTYQNALNFKITLRHFINSLWNNEAVQGSIQQCQEVLWFTRKESTFHTEYLSSAILNQIKIQEQRQSLFGGIKACLTLFQELQTLDLQAGVWSDCTVFWVCFCLFLTGVSLDLLYVLERNVVCYLTSIINPWFM